MTTFQDVNKMNSMKPNKTNLTVMSRIFLIILMDILATAASFFFGLWFRYDFVFADIRQAHLEGFLSAIGPWCAITVLVFMVFKLYNSIWVFVSTSEVFRILGAYVVLGLAGV